MTIVTTILSAIVSFVTTVVCTLFVIYGVMITAVLTLELCKGLFKTMKKALCVGVRYYKHRQEVARLKKYDVVAVPVPMWTAMLEWK